MFKTPAHELFYKIAVSPAFDPGAVKRLRYTPGLTSSLLGRIHTHLKTDAAKYIPGLAPSLLDRMHTHLKTDAGPTSDAELDLYHLDGKPEEGLYTLNPHSASFTNAGYFIYFHADNETASILKNTPVERAQESVFNASESEIVAKWRQWGVLSSYGGAAGNKRPRPDE
jgi:hypothetical protein